MEKSQFRVALTTLVTQRACTRIDVRFRYGECTVGVARVLLSGRSPLGSTGLAAKYSSGALGLYTVVVVIVLPTPMVTELFVFAQLTIATLRDSAPTVLRSRQLG